MNVGILRTTESAGTSQKDEKRDLKERLDLAPVRADVVARRLRDFRGGRDMKFGFGATVETHIESISVMAEKCQRARQLLALTNAIDRHTRACVLETCLTQVNMLR